MKFKIGRHAGTGEFMSVAAAKANKGGAIVETITVTKKTEQPRLNTTPTTPQKKPPTR